MRDRFGLLAAAALSWSVLLGDPVWGQQPGESDAVRGGPLVQEGRGRQGGPPNPAPRSADGRILLGGATPDEKGVWVPGPGITAVAIKPPEEVPFQPWARQVFDERQVHELALARQADIMGGL